MKLTLAIAIILLLAIGASMSACSYAEFLLDSTRHGCWSTSAWVIVAPQESPPKRDDDMERDPVPSANPGSTR